MEGRCAVETVGELGDSGTCTPRVKLVIGTFIFFCNGSDEVHVFSSQERKLTAVIQCPGPVTDLGECHDNQLLYVACRSGVYCANSQFLLSRAHSVPADASSSPAELNLSSEFLAVAEEGVSSLLLAGSVLLTLSQRDTSWVLTLYKASNYEMLSSFSLPLVSGVAHTEGKTATRPLLSCVYSNLARQPPSPCTLNNGQFLLEPLLFKLLFGVDAALTKSPVILCGLPDGSLYFLPLRPPGSQPRVLHSLEQPIVFVGASAVVETGAQCLVAVGELGRVVLIKTETGGSEGVGNRTVFIEGCVPGPVLCGCVDKSCLYYSTGSDLLGLDLSAGSKPSGPEASRKTDAGLQSPMSLNVCRVVALVEPTCSAAGEVQLLGLSARGRLLRITLPQQDATQSKVPSTLVGRSIRDLLSAIGDVCERASLLKTSIKSKNQILKHLNHMLNVSFLLINTKEHLPIQEKSIRCHATTSWSRLLQKDSLHLTCVLENSSPYVLERGWTLSLAVFPLSDPPSAGGESGSTTFSFPLHSVHPGDTFEVSLPLTAADEASIPVTVSCSLVFSLSSLLRDEAADVLGLQSSYISLPLNVLTVDWLHALQLHGPIANRKMAVFPPRATTDTVQAFLRSRRVGCSGRGKGSGESASKSEQEQYTAKVWVSTELLRDTLVLSGSDSDPQNVGHSLLEWLISEGFGGVTAGHQGAKVALSSSVVHARGPDGHTVKLTAKEVNVGEENTGKDESLTTVEVQVESSSLAAVCGLHHALLSRILTLLQRAPDRATSTKSVQSLGLRRVLQRAEHLLQQIRQSRISEAFSVGVSTGQMTPSLLSVYRELREKPLLVL